MLASVVARNSTLQVDLAAKLFRSLAGSSSTNLERLTSAQAEFGLRFVGRTRFVLR